MEGVAKLATSEFIVSRVFCYIIKKKLILGTIESSESAFF